MDRGMNSLDTSTLTQMSLAAMRYRGLLVKQMVQMKNRISGLLRTSNGGL